MKNPRNAKQIEVDRVVCRTPYFFSSFGRSCKKGMRINEKSEPGLSEIEMKVDVDPDICR